MAKLTTTDLAVPFASGSHTVTNSNFAAVETAMEKTLSRDGTSPNAMEANLDMNSNRIINLPEPVSDNEAARKIDLVNIYTGNVGLATTTADGLMSAEDKSKINEIVSVKDYGAVGDGVTDDAAAINAAISAAAPFAAFTRSGVKVYFPAGVYAVGSTIDLTEKHGVHLVGDGRQITEIKAIANVPVVTIAGASVSDVTVAAGVSNMTIRGYGYTSLNAHGIHTTWTNSCVFDNLYILQCRYAYYQKHGFQNELTRVRITGDGSEKNYIGVFLDASTLANVDNAVFAVNVNVQYVDYCSFRIINGQGSKFVNCEALNGSYGFYVGEPPTGTVECRWLHFTNCLADSTTYPWAFIQGSATALGQIQLTGCWSGNGSQGFYLDGMDGAAITGFQSIGHTKSGIVLQNSTNVTIVGGLIQDCNEESAADNDDIRLQGSTYCTVLGVVCETPNAGSYSFKETGAADHNRIVGNSFPRSGVILGTNSKGSLNKGFKTEARGSTTLGAGVTSIAVNHGLAITPSIDEISVTPRSNLTAAGISSFWITNATSTQFTVNLDANVGGADFAWKISTIRE